MPSVAQKDGPCPHPPSPTHSPILLRPPLSTVSLAKAQPLFARQVTWVAPCIFELGTLLFYIFSGMHGRGIEAWVRAKHWGIGLCEGGWPPSQWVLQPLGNHSVPLPIQPNSFCPINVLLSTIKSKAKKPKQVHLDHRFYPL